MLTRTVKLYLSSTQVFIFPLSQRKQMIKNGRNKPWDLQLQYLSLAGEEAYIKSPATGVANADTSHRESFKVIELPDNRHEEEVVN